MFNFKIKGKFKSEDELINGKQLPDGAIQFKEGDSLQDAFIKGLLIGLPLFVVMIVSMIFRLRNVNYEYPNRNNICNNDYYSWHTTLCT